MSTLNLFLDVAPPLMSWEMFAKAMENSTIPEHPLALCDKIIASTERRITYWNKFIEGNEAEKIGRWNSGEPTQPYYQDKIVLFDMIKDNANTMKGVASYIKNMLNKRRAARPSHIKLLDAIDNSVISSEDVIMAIMSHEKTITKIINKMSGVKIQHNNVQVSVNKMYEEMKLVTQTQNLAKKDVEAFLAARGGKSRTIRNRKYKRSSQTRRRY